MAQRRGGGRWERWRTPLQDALRRLGAAWRAGALAGPWAGWAAPVMMAWWQGEEMLSPELSCGRDGEISTTPPAYPGCQKLLPMCAEPRKAVISSLLVRSSTILETLWGIHIKIKKKFWNTNFLLKMQWSYTTSCLCGILEKCVFSPAEKTLCFAELCRDPKMHPCYFMTRTGSGRERSASSSKL